MLMCLSYVILMCCICSCVAYSFNNINNFKNEEPRARFPDLVKELGNNYMLFTDDNGGIVRWENPKFYESVMMLDECVKHDDPEPHCDFLYTTIKVHIPSESVNLVLGLSDSIYYDKLKGLLTTRCHFMGANVSTMILALLIAEEPKKFEIYYKRRSSLIEESMESKRYEELEKILKELIKQNKKMKK